MCPCNCSDWGALYQNGLENSTWDSTAALTNVNATRVQVYCEKYFSNLVSTWILHPLVPSKVCKPKTVTTDPKTHHYVPHTYIWCFQMHACGFRYGGHSFGYTYLCRVAKGCIIIIIIILVLHRYTKTNTKLKSHNMYHNNPFGTFECIMNVSHSHIVLVLTFKICVNLDTIAYVSVVFKLDFLIGSFILSCLDFLY